MKNVHIHNLKNLVSTCSSKQTFKTPLLSKYINSTINNQHKSRLSFYDKHCIDSTVRSSMLIVTLILSILDINSKH